MGINVTDMGLEKKPTGQEIKKHAATIHCSNTLSLLQRKISNALLYHAYAELATKEEHEITVKQLCKLISYHGNNHAVIKEAFRGLLSTVIEWNLVNDTTGKEDWTASSILASVSLQGPLCYFAYSPRMKQLLHSPSMFGKINLFIQSRFKSSYGLALYENCIRYRGLPHTKWFDLELFRKLMGVPPGKYMVFRDFKRRVLDKSIEEVNTYSDIIVTSEVLREGRQVAKIRFLIKERAKKTRLGSKSMAGESEQIPDPLAELKTQLNTVYGLTHDQIDQLLAEYGSDYIVEKMNIIETSPNYKKGRVQNLAAYLLSALKNNYQLPKTSAEKAVTRRQQAADQKKLQRTVTLIKEGYQAYRDEQIDLGIEKLSPYEKQYFFDEFYQYAASSIATIMKLQRGKYTKETVIHSPPIKALLRQFAAQQLELLQTSLMSIHDYVDTLPLKEKEVWQQFKLVSQQLLEKEIE